MRKFRVFACPFYFVCLSLCVCVPPVALTIVGMYVEIVYLEIA